MISTAKIHILQIYIDIEAEESFILDPCVLCNHEDVLLGDQMLYDVLDFVRCFDGLLLVCDRVAHLHQHFLYHSIDHVALLNVVSTLLLELAHDTHGQVREALILVEADLYFPWLTGLASCAMSWCTSSEKGRLTRVRYLSVLELILSQLIFPLGLLMEPFLVPLFVDGFLYFFELDIVLLNVDVAVAEETTDLSNVVWPDLVIAVSTSHGL